MNPEALATTLKAMKLYGMADAVNELAAQSSPAYKQAAPVLEMLLKAESSERELRSINYQMKVAKFPAYRDLTGFDFSQSRSMRRW
jgi:DNA replication protein DnaC